MLWLIVILLIGALSFVIFHKPHVNAMGAGWVPPEKRQPVQPPVAPKADGKTTGDAFAGEEAVTAPVEKQPAPMPETFDFNDLFGGAKRPGPTDRPNA